MLDTFGSHPKKIRVKESWIGSFVLHPLGRIPNRPSGFKMLTADSAACFQHGGVVLFPFWDVRRLIWGRDSLSTLHFLLSFWFSSFSHLFFFSSFLHFLSLVLEFLGILEREQGCPRLIQGCSRLQIKNILPGEVFRRPRTAAYKFQNSDSEDSAQIQAKFCKNQSCLHFFKFNPGEGRDILYITLSPFCEIRFLSIYFIYLKLIDLNAK